VIPNKSKRLNVESEQKKRERALAIITLLQQATKDMVRPASEEIVRKYGQSPFLVLISCLLSLRTKDTVSLPASCRLFDYAKTPQELLCLSCDEIEKIIYPVGFYRKKAQILHRVSKMLLDAFHGQVPCDEDSLLSLPGVGRKTMSLVQSVGFGIPAICVDTHVHRISNRLGLVQTQTPEQTEMALKALLPPIYWSAYNHLLVMWGQNVCVPISPFCSACPLASHCPRVGVKRHR
jgi:endonuclease III